MPKPSKSSHIRSQPTIKPRPFKSILLPFVHDIKAWRRAGKTWQEVADLLKERGVKTDPSACCRFIGRYNRRPYPRGAEPEQTLPSSPVPAGPAQPAKSPKSSESARPPEPPAKPGDRYRKAIGEYKPKPTKLFTKDNIIE